MNALSIVYRELERLPPEDDAEQRELATTDPRRRRPARHCGACQAGRRGAATHRVAAVPRDLLVVAVAGVVRRVVLARPRTAEQRPVDAHEHGAANGAVARRDDERLRVRSLAEEHRASKLVRAGRRPHAGPAGAPVSDTSTSRRASARRSPARRTSAPRLRCAGGRRTAFDRRGETAAAGFVLAIVPCCTPERPRAPRASRTSRDGGDGGASRRTSVAATCRDDERDARARVSLSSSSTS